MMKEKVIFLVDMQSFYASVEKAENPHLKNRPVIVSGDPKRRSGVVLAACPLAKKKGVANASRLWEAQEKCPEAVVLRPRMQRYIDVSLQITAILEEYTDMVEPYSIDEQFMDVTGSQKLFGRPEDIARSIQDRVMREMGVYARVGIGPNKALAKIACDNFAKKNASGIFYLTENNMKTHMWPLPVGCLFGVGSRMKHHLRRMGISTIGGLAAFPVELLKKKWGINGHVLWMTANGIDYSPVTTASLDGQKAIGHGMTLPKDYEHFDREIKVVLLELCEEVCRRSRRSGAMGQTVSVSCRGADFDIPTGFHRQVKLSEPTNRTQDVYRAVCRLFLAFWDGKPVRRLGVSLSQLSSDDVWQLNLFHDYAKNMSLGYVMDGIKSRFGDTAIVRASSLTAAGQAFERAAKIGGHYK
ncbi:MULTISPECIES: DNA polymerase IV [Bacillus]|uniref:DNA polymerase IV n=1 Tax=Bacillus TaxID=1386 RepID=UPI000B4565A0|nr:MULTISPECIES: DNA polymerase IV [Bacillus]MBT2626633.1 DNA polymerase IV [Bacillus sp. ISL-32]ARW07385.1 DNA-directed DNA polymerase [Bacillus atrophaeus]MBJ7896818.1 DNA polymerase IV [Bacillus atrophaeus]MCI3196648.1 DNA polymerase IV [Bacillus sp. HU-1818]MCY8514886.1 DNA polymerase IV [Bacillus atrophaeus]